MKSSTINMHQRKKSQEIYFETSGLEIIDFYKNTIH